MEFFFCCLLRCLLLKPTILDWAAWKKSQTVPLKDLQGQTQEEYHSKYCLEHEDFDVLQEAHVILEQVRQFIK